MFADRHGPRVFAQPPGSNFADDLVNGLLGRTSGLAPEVLARTEIYVNVRSLRSGLIERFIARGNCLLPRIHLLSSLSGHHGFPELPSQASQLARSLYLTRLVNPLLGPEGGSGSHNTLYSLSSSLEALLDEMQCEGLDMSCISTLDLADLPTHRQNSFSIIKEIDRQWDEAARPGRLGRMRMVVERLAGSWWKDPPDHPIIVAGSTGSVGATRLFMEAVARLPQGAIVLPGFDSTMSMDIRKAIIESPVADHPQHNIIVLLESLGIGPGDVKTWHASNQVNPDRNRLVSLSMLPVESTHLWRDGIASVGDIAGATSGITYVEAPSERIEARAIAIRLRQAFEEGKTGALVTPDIRLVRQVRTALERWSIIPNDSFGTTLDMTPTGSLLNCIAGMMGRELTAESIITLLEHPLASNAGSRTIHRSFTDKANIFLRNRRSDTDLCKQLYSWSGGQGDGSREWLIPWLELFEDLEDVENDALDRMVDTHIDLVTEAAADVEEGSTWQDSEDGKRCISLLRQLRRESSEYGAISPADYSGLLQGLLHATRFLHRGPVHANMLIWNTEDARMQRPDVIIAGRLNRGSWPAQMIPDMWLNRQLRNQLGLSPPESRIGLSAHDYQHVMAVEDVVITRCLETPSEPTLPSRWLLRLNSILEGIEPHGRIALQDMRERGNRLIEHAMRIDTPDRKLPPAARPVPCPAVEFRPRKLPVTRIRTLINNPYAIHARDILDLPVLDKLSIQADARVRGNVLHRIMEAFVRDSSGVPKERWETSLLAIAEAEFGKARAPEFARSMWFNTFRKIVGDIIRHEMTVSNENCRIEIETSCEFELEGLGCSLIARADRIESDREGVLRVYDYKSGKAPGETDIKAYDRQLPTLISLAGFGAFTGDAEREVGMSGFLRIGDAFEVKELPKKLDVPKMWQELLDLVRHYMRPESGYPSRRSTKDYDGQEYDHLARFNEWRYQQVPPPETSR